MLTKHEARVAGRSAGKAAASWLSPGSEREAKKLLQLLEDGDPRLDEYLPRRPDLSGEFAGESVNEILEVTDEDHDEYGDDLQDHIDDLAGIWQEAADEGYDSEINRILDDWASGS